MKNMGRKDSVNMMKSRHKFPLGNKIKRVAWGFTYFLLFRPFSLRIFKQWRVFLLKCYGAEVSWTSMINSSVKIWAPWNLEMGEFSCLGPDVDCYNQGKVTVGANSVISQKVYLCASTHDHSKIENPLVVKPICIGERVWVAADSFIGPGVNIGEGSVIGARSVVVRDMPPWMVCAGHPCKPIKERVLNDTSLPAITKLNH